jgi:hypothetical protein
MSECTGLACTENFKALPGHRDRRGFVLWARRSCVVELSKAERFLKRFQGVPARKPTALFLTYLSTPADNVFACSAFRYRIPEGATPASFQA